MSLAWSPDGSALAAGCADGTLWLWKAASGELAAVLSGHTGRVESVAWSPDGSVLSSAGGCGDSTVRSGPFRDPGV